MQDFLRSILGSRKDLYVQIGITTGQIYREIILQQHLCLFWGAMVAKFVFMNENGHSQRTNIVNQCLQSKNV